MENDTRAAQILRIIQSLATLPGGKKVDVSFKKLPRLGPAEPGTSYQASTSSFEVAQVPSFVAVPRDTEEVVIRLSGALAGTLNRDLLVDELREFFDASNLHDNWDVRVNFLHNQDRPPQYELTVFSHLFVTGAEAWA